MGSGSSLALAVTFPLSYVALLYVFDHDGTDRNDPKSVRRRFAAAVVNNVLSVIVTYGVLYQAGDAHPLSTMGFRLSGLWQAIVYPGVLISVLYFGQWLLMYFDRQLRTVFSLDDWRNSFGDICWVRDAIVAPITEEVVFRGCAATLMLRALSPTATIFCCPLSFAISHIHHVADDMRRGFTFGQALTRRLFQFVYTYAFGAFATFLFLRTRHIAAPIVVHMICNSLGLPMFGEIGSFPHTYQRVSLTLGFVTGIIGFACLVVPLTNSRLYRV